MIAKNERFSISVKTVPFQSKNWFLKSDVWQSFGFASKGCGFKIRGERSIPGRGGHVYVDINGAKAMAKQARTKKDMAGIVIRWLESLELASDEIDEPIAEQKERQLTLNNLRTFGSGEFANVRWSIVDGQPLAVALDALRTIGYQKPQRAMEALRDAPPPLCTPYYGEDKDERGQTQNYRLLSMPQLMYLISRAAGQSNSRAIRDMAGKFNVFVFAEVMPSVYEKGYYVRPGAEESVKQDFSMIPERATFSMDEAMTLVNSKDRNAQFYEIMMSRLDKKDKQIEELTRLVGKLVDKL